MQTPVGVIHNDPGFAILWISLLDGLGDLLCSAIVFIYRNNKACQMGFEPMIMLA